MYGIDAVNSWPRLLAVIAYGALVVTNWTLAAPWLALMLLAFLWPAARRA